jgi:hypothetical protein
MIITKRIERLYLLKEYENVKIVLEATEDIGDKNPETEYKRLNELLMEQLRLDAAVIARQKK